MRPPRRALTGRDASGKSIFQSFDVTPRIVTLESRPGLAFYEMYATDDVPRLTGREPDPTTTKKVFFQRVFFPRPHGSLFTLTLFPPRPPEGSTPSPGGFEKYLEDCLKRFRGWLSTSNAIHPECTPRILLTTASSSGGGDDGKTVHLRQGDCVVQNGTRHRWRNPLSEPYLMA